jgi:hypothetical protein
MNIKLAHSIYLKEQQELELLFSERRTQARNVERMMMMMMMMMMKKEKKKNGCLKDTLERLFKRHVVE